MATTKPAKGWTYTSGYPKGLKQSTVHPPIANEIKGLGTTAHMLVKIKAAALNPVDIQMMNLPRFNSKELGAGLDFSGVIEAGGRTGFIKGEEVFGLTMKPFEPAGGSLAEMAEFNMANSVAVKKPKDWSHEQAASVSLVWLTARTCIENVAQAVEDSDSKRVAVLGGSSATGIYTIIIAKKRGWKVIATSSEKNKEFVTSTLGSDEHVDYTKGSTRSAVAKFEPAAVIDCVGGTECIGLPSSKRYVSIVGDKTGRSTMGGPFTYYNFLSYHAPLQWIRWARGVAGLGESYDIIMLEMKKEWLEEAKETLTPDSIFIDSTFGFGEVKQAFERLNTGRARGKVVVRIDA